MTEIEKRFRIMAEVPDKELVALEFPKDKIEEAITIIFDDFSHSFELIGGRIIVFPPEVAEVLEQNPKLSGTERIKITPLDKLKPEKLKELRSRYLIPR